MYFGGPTIESADTYLFDTKRMCSTLHYNIIIFLKVNSNIIAKKGTHLASSIQSKAHIKSHSPVIPSPSKNPRRVSQPNRHTLTKPSPNEGFKGEEIQKACISYHATDR